LYIRNAWFVKVILEKISLNEAAESLTLEENPVIMAEVTITRQKDF